MPFNLKENQSIPLIIPNERQSAARLSVIEEQDFKRRQEFSVTVNKNIKNIFIKIEINFFCSLEMLLKMLV
jgi:hypothetical protein